MFSLATVFKVDPLDPVRGKYYRDKILRPGGSQEEMDSLKVGFTISDCRLVSLMYTTQDFLGRTPTNKFFLEQIFGSPSGSSQSSL